MKELDKWIRDNINQNMDTIINTSIDDVENKVTLLHGFVCKMKSSL